MRVSDGLVHSILGAAVAICLSRGWAAEYHVSPAGNDHHPGTAAEPFQTIGAAAERAMPGDVITVHAGIYRERVNPPRGGTSDDKRILYQAAPGETVVIKGSERVTSWKHVEADTWVATVPHSLFQGANPFAELIRGDWYEARRPYHTAAVYLRGHWLKQAARKSELLPTDADGAAEGRADELISLSLLTGEEKNSAEVPATQYQAASGPVQAMTLANGQPCLAKLPAGATLQYEMDFGERAQRMTIHAASPIEGGLVEIRAGEPQGELLGTFDVGFTAHWTSFQPFQANLTRTMSGKQTIVLVIKPRPAPARVDPDAALWFAEVGNDATTLWAQFKSVDPNREMVEVNARSSVFYPDQPGRNYITVRGFILEHAATPWAPPTAEQVGLIGTHWSKGWVIEGNTIRYSTCAGLTLGKGRDKYDNRLDYLATIRVSSQNGWNRDTVGSHVVQNNHISHCGQAGICGSLGCSFSKIIGNEVHDIKKNHDYYGYEAAGIKLHGFVDGLIQGNHIHRCEHWGGLWLDWMAQGARVTGNLFHDNSQDMMFEVNHGPFLVDHNLLLSRTGVTKVSSSGAYVHNLWCGPIQLWPKETRQTPHMKPHSTEIVQEAAAIHQSDDRYENNLFVGGKGTSGHDEHGFALMGHGNVFLSGAAPSRHEKNAHVPPPRDPRVQLTQQAEGWWLSLEVDPAWNDVARHLVTTERLGTAAVTGARYEQADGSPYRLDRDYLGSQHAPPRVSPGPFAFSTQRTLRVKVWPTTSSASSTSDSTPSPSLPTTTP